MFFRYIVEEFAELHREMNGIISKAPAMMQAMIAFKKAAERIADTPEFKEFMIELEGRDE